MKKYKKLILITIIILCCGCKKEQYYCYSNHTLSDKMCFYKETYAAKVSCPPGFYVTHTNACASQTNGAILPNVKKTYSCPQGGYLQDDICIVEHTYNALTENPNERKEQTSQSEVEEMVLTNAKHYFNDNNGETKVNISELIAQGYLTKEEVTYKKYVCDGYVISTSEGLKVHLKCSK